MTHINFILESARDAMTMCESGCVTALPVEGGYMVTEWSDYYRRLREEAASLYDGGWRATDPDIIDSLIAEYCEEDNKITREWAEDLKGYLATIELKDAPDPETSEEMNKFYLLVWREGRLIDVERYTSEHFTRKIFRKMLNVMFRNSGINKPDLYGSVRCCYKNNGYSIFGVARIRMTSHYNMIYSDTNTKHQVSSVFINGYYVKTMGNVFSQYRRKIGV